MPGRNGTGPMGNGAASGRGLGACKGVNSAGYGAGSRMGQGMGQGMGRGMGCGRNFAADPTASLTPKELLQEQKEFLEVRLGTISKQLERL